MSTHSCIQNIIIEIKIGAFRFLFVVIQRIVYFIKIIDIGKYYCRAFATSHLTEYCVIHCIVFQDLNTCYLVVFISLNISLMTMFMDGNR